MLQHAIRMGGRGSCSGGGPGSHSRPKARSKGSAMFDKGKRRFDPGQNPGPAEYFMHGNNKPDGANSNQIIPRANRVLPGEITKPDYDMSVFYEDKGPTIKPKTGGYTISNTGGVDFVKDPSNNEGIGNYAWT